MNLFLIESSAKKIARSHSDVHVVKMLLEVAQMLYAAWWCCDPDGLAKRCQEEAICPYKKTHQNHPVSRWIRAKPNHYRFAVNVGLELCQEYSLRYHGNAHKTQRHLEHLQKIGPPRRTQCEVQQPSKKKRRIDAAPSTPPLNKRATVGLPPGISYYDCAIDDDAFLRCQVRLDDGSLDAIETYRNYYRMKRSTMKISMRWKFQDRVPTWMMGKP